MALLLGMMNGRKHGHQHPPIKKQEPICWLEKWLHEDMGDIVQILFLSYDFNLWVFITMLQISAKTSFIAW